MSFINYIIAFSFVSSIINTIRLFNIEDKLKDLPGCDFDEESEEALENLKELHKKELKIH